VDQLKRQGCAVTLFETTASGSGGDLAREAVRQGAECILAAGGDGTISEVAGGLAGSNTPLGILPAGTANVLAHELGIPSHPAEAASRLATWTPRRVALGLIESPAARPRYFLMMAGAGFDADVVYNLDAQLKLRLGRLSYWIGGISKLSRKLDRLHARIAGQEYACSFALVSRVRNYGGDFNIARDITLSQDDFEIVLLESDNALGYLRYFAGIMTQKLQHDPGVRFFRARQVELLPSGADTVHLQADGEYVGALPSTLRVVPGALTLLTPPEYVKTHSNPAAAASV
jgi:diacylglycerol kinase (ATP)